MVFETRTTLDEETFADRNFRENQCREIFQGYRFARVYEGEKDFFS